ncbi:hypothetical protein SAMN05444412_10367 [Rhodonellum ikkaensis]|uniref:Uncharacterized protein n=1 Tax=Rhodonellum ikkaensis TaxID=336829 RepID=A0A1H3N2F5_9BACT|nr:hypothetical protein SAMN05444412_10367 [Rhodonellum ikkaensis]
MNYRINIINPHLKKFVIPVCWLGFILILIIYSGRIYWLLSIPLFTFLLIITIGNYVVNRKISKMYKCKSSSEKILILRNLLLFNKNYMNSYYILIGLYFSMIIFFGQISTIQLAMSYLLPMLIVSIYSIRKTRIDLDKKIKIYNIKLLSPD